MPAMAHILSFIEKSPYPDGYFVCNLCWEKGSGAAYHCAQCDFNLHTSCAASTKQQTHFTHFRHPLHLKSFNNIHICDGCGRRMGRWSFRCDLCDYDMHSLCVRAPRFVVHPSHDHVLKLCEAGDEPASCCGDDTANKDYHYRCSSCNYGLHLSCATLPRKISHPQHAMHNLTLAFGSNSFTCDECGEQGKGWLFRCPRCRYNLHTKCAEVSHELPHADLQTLSHEMDLKAALPDSDLRDTMPATNVTETDLEAAERVLSFVRCSMRKTSAPLMSVGSSSMKLQNKNREICPTCLEEYDLGNPKQTTSCGHNFHLACLLQWMERSNLCPICRRVINMADES